MNAKMNETRVTETRYDIGVLAVLIELNTALISLLVAFFANVDGYGFVCVVGIVIATVCIIEAFSMKEVGYCHRLKSAVGNEPEWTISQVDIEELRENGEVIIYG